MRSLKGKIPTRFLRKYFLNFEHFPYPQKMYANPFIQEGVARFPERLNSVLPHTEQEKHKQMNTSKFDLWGMLHKCEVLLDLPTLAERSPLCHKELYQQLIQRRSRVLRKTKETEHTVQIVDMLMDSEAPSTTVDIGDHSVIGVQLDGGVAVSLMTKQTM